MNNPGIHKKVFKIQMNAEDFNKGDILKTSNNVQVKVLKVYKFNWWRKLLLKMGFNIKFFKGVKVENV